MKATITWSAYPVFESGCYAYFGNLTLTAHPSGSWNVWERPGTGRGRMEGSGQKPISIKEQNLESAKAKAEAAARNMNTIPTLT